LLSEKENSSHEAQEVQVQRRLRIQRAVVPSPKATKRGLIKPVEVFNCAIIGACHLSQKHKPPKLIADSG
jgi:hypothetical protein